MQRERSLGREPYGLAADGSSTNRLGERGYVPVAALFVVVLLGAAVIAFDSSKIVGTNEAQLAQVTTVTKSSTSAEPPAQPPGATEQEICINDNYITINIQQEEGSKPTTKSESGTYSTNQTPPKKGCFARFCSERIPTSVNPATEACTQYRYFAESADLKAVSRSADVNLAANSSSEATKMFATGVVDDVKVSGLGQADALSGLPANTSNAVLRAFDDQQSFLTDAYKGQLRQATEYEKFLNDCRSLGTCPQDEIERAQAGMENARKEAAFKKAELDSLAATRGEVATVLARDPGAGVPYNCREDPTCNREVYGGRPASTFDRDTRAPPYIPPRTSTGGVLSGTLGVLSALLGGGQGMQQQQCILSYNPPIVQPYPAQPGCLNYNPMQQQQQQCSVLLQLFDKCPTGSYNPNNPTNPYGYPAPTCAIQASPTSVSAAGQATTLQWQSQNASYAYLSNSGQIGPSGTMTVYPQTSTTYTMNVVGYGNQQGRCQASVNVGSQGTSTAPTAQISCQPQTVDVGTQIAIAFACQNSATANGTGFSTGGALSGSAVATATAPTLGQNTITYGLNCSNQGRVHSAQCTINVNKAAIVLVATPRSVASGGRASLGWVTTGMDACIISSPTLHAFTDENATSTSVSGGVRTPALSASAQFVLTCLTRVGAIRRALAVVNVVGMPPASTTLSEIPPLSVRHAQCRLQFGPHVMGTIDGFKELIGAGTSTLSSSHATFYSETLDDCAGVVILENEDRNETDTFVFNARTDSLLDFDSDEWLIVFEEFVDHLDQI